MRTVIPSRSILAVPFLAFATGLAAAGPGAAADAGSPAQPPVSQSNTAKPSRYVITDYGAVADAATLHTAAIQKAIDAAAAAGGGVAEIPEGRFLSGSIFLKKGVELRLDEGAVLLGSQNIDDYPKEQTRIEGHFQAWRMALVNAQGMDHVRIGGSGQLNGNGAPFWAQFRARIRQIAPRLTLMSSAPAWFSSTAAQTCAWRESRSRIPGFETCVCTIAAMSPSQACASRSRSDAGRSDRQSQHRWH